MATGAIDHREAGRMPWTLGVRRGLACRCPACGEGRAFRAFLKVVDTCPACGETLSHHRADDLPPYVTIFIVAHIVGYGMFVTETNASLPLWVSLTLWPILTIVLAVALMQPVKGAVVGLQYALGMHGFGARQTEDGERERYGSGADRAPDERGA